MVCDNLGISKPILVVLKYMVYWLPSIVFFCIDNIWSDIVTIIGKLYG